MGVLAGSKEDERWGGTAQEEEPEDSQSDPLIIYEDNPDTVKENGMLKKLVEKLKNKNKDTEKPV